MKSNVREAIEAIEAIRKGQASGNYSPAKTSYNASSNVDQAVSAIDAIRRGEAAGMSQQVYDYSAGKVMPVYSSPSRYGLNSVLGGSTASARRSEPENISDVDNGSATALSAYREAVNNYDPSKSIAYRQSLEEPLRSNPNISDDELYRQMQEVRYNTIANSEGFRLAEQLNDYAASAGEELYLQEQEIEAINRQIE